MLGFIVGLLVVVQVLPFNLPSTAGTPSEIIFSPKTEVRSCGSIFMPAQC